MDTSYCKEQPKKIEDIARRKKVETQTQTVLTLDLYQIIKFVYYLDGPLGEGNV
jgi:hypothetical protein